MRRIPFVLTMFLVSIPAAAQSIGNYVLYPNSSAANLARPYTIIDVSSPATTAGTIGAVAIRANSPCTNGFKVKFFHLSGSTFTPFAERGPFDITGPLTTVTITPPVAVVPGDVIGIVALQDCASPVGQVPLLFRNAAQFQGEVTTPVTLGDAAQVLLSYAVAIYGAPSRNSEIRTQIIPAAGAAQGAFGASFKTDIFITNTRSTRSAGRLVYHPENTSGTPDDPTFPYIVDARTSLTYPNFIQTTLGLQGKGSIDVYTTIGYEPPSVSARIYEDGSAGTKGFTLEGLTEPEALTIFESGVLFGPIDPAKYRMNIAWRTLNNGARLEFQLWGSNGVSRGFANNVYPANFYGQTDFTTLFGGVTPQAGDTIIVIPREGSAYVIGSIIDNNSNDPSAQVAKQLK